MTTTPFDILCPQHLCFDNDGIITHVGPGLRSVISPAADQSLFDLLTILRPLEFLIYPRFLPMRAAR